MHLQRTRQVNDSMKKLSIVSEVAVTNTNVDDIIVNGKLIGEGEFGKTYFYNEKIIKLVEIKSTKQLKNEIESARHNQDLQSLHYKTFEKKGTKSISALCACPRHILPRGCMRDRWCSVPCCAHSWQCVWQSTTG